MLDCIPDRLGNCLHLAAAGWATHYENFRVLLQKDEDFTHVVLSREVRALVVLESLYVVVAGLDDFWLTIGRIFKDVSLLQLAVPRLIRCLELVRFTMHVEALAATLQIVDAFLVLLQRLLQVALRALILNLLSATTPPHQSTEETTVVFAAVFVADVQLRLIYFIRV